MAEQVLPHVLVVGAQKSGTQSLTHYLDQHPQIRMCRREVDFFSADHNWNRGVDWYLGELPAVSGARIVGETSPSYAMYPHYPDAARRIVETVPDVRIVFVMREPVERMRSAYLHALTRGAETRSMDEALLDDPFYLDTSRYAMQIGRYTSLLPRTSLTLLLAEDLRTRRRETVARVVQALGLPTAVDDGRLEHEANVTAGRRVPRAWARALGDRVIRRGWDNRVLRRLGALREQQSPLLTRRVRPAETQMSPMLRSELVRRLRPDLVELRSHLGQDFHGWGLLEA